MKYLSRSILLHLYDTYRKSPNRDPMTSYGQLFSELKTSLGHSSDYIESLYEPEFHAALRELKQLGYIRERGMSRVYYYELTDSGKRQAAQWLEVVRRDRDRTSQFLSQRGTDYSSPVKTGEIWPVIVFFIVAVLVVVGILVVKGTIPVPALMCRENYKGRTVLVSPSVKMRQAPGFSSAPCASNGPAPNPYPTPHPSHIEVVDGPVHAEGKCWWRLNTAKFGQRNCSGWVPQDVLSASQSR